MTDRDIMLEVEAQLEQLVADFSQGLAPDPGEICQKIRKIQEKVHCVTTSAIDYQVVLDNLDENILIANGTEDILYVNSAYVRNTGIAAENLIGYKVSDILQSKKYFTVASVPDVIKRKERVTKLSNLFGEKKPGIVTGAPIFDKEGKIQYVVAINKAISSFLDLRDNFTEFLRLLDSARSDSRAIQVIENSRNISPDYSMVGQGPAMQQIRKFIRNVSQTDATVLITGESGSGKELIAEEVYRLSRRANMPFIKINCSAIPAQLLESELFGYEKGAFSGANAQGKKGLFEAANKGTLLLDEIGDMPMHMQAKLLRAIQSNEITRVGGTKPIKLDIRLIASTNCNLMEKVKNGTFRKDLYYRLHIIPIDVPPLRERREDIPLLCEYYLDIFSKRYGRSVKLSQENIEVMTNYTWPGNIRELRNIMEYLTVCCSDREEINSAFLYGLFDMDADNAYVELNQEMTLNDAVAAYEREFLKNAIQGVKNLKEASQILDVDISTVSRKLKQYGLSIKH